MNMLSDFLLSTSAGAAFGAALTASRVYLPTVIINQMRFQDFHMLEVFFTASASSAIVIFALEKLGIAKRSIRGNSSLGWFSSYDGNIIGGALIGVGMGVTGACPGTVLPQLAHGIPSARATAVGGLLGGLAYAKIGKSLIAPAKFTTNENEKPHLGRRTIASKFGISPSLVLIAFEMITLTTVALSALLLPGRSFSIMPTVAGGLLIGLAQTVSIIFTSSPLGVSTAYEQLGAYIWRFLGFNDVQSPPQPPKAITFALGILLGSLITGHCLPPASVSEVVSVPQLQGLIGGFALTFGARMAGGCTSGHGLSGLSALSFSSLITTTAMFSAGIVVRLLMEAGSQVQG